MVQFVRLLSNSRLIDIRQGMISIANEVLPNAARAMKPLALRLQIGKDRHQPSIKGPKKI